MKKIINLTLLVTVYFTASVFCETFKYESRGKRDPFVPLIGQEKAEAAGLSEVVSVEDISLEGIAIGAKGKHTAIINGEMVKVGYKAGEVEVKRIDRKFVILLIGQKEFKISLPEEGGRKIES